MPQLTWDNTGERFYETGVDHGVLYLPDNTTGAYNKGYAWNGLTSVSEAPSGAEPNPQYADNIKYLNLVSVEEFGGTIEAFTYPEQFGVCDGSVSPVKGLHVGQQLRSTFGLSYRTRIGNDLVGDTLAYKLHLVYGALAAPTEKQYQTVNDSPEAMTLSWEFTTTPVPAPGMRPTALLTIDSRTVDATKLKTLEGILYGASAAEPKLPLPAEVFTTLGVPNTPA